MTASANANNVQNSVFTISRVLDAPLDLVFAVHSQPEHLVKWWGPLGSETEITTFDFKPNGTYHYCLKAAGLYEMWGKLTYLEIDAPNMIKCIVSISNKEGGIARHPFSPTWPLELLATTTFTAQGDKTLLSVEWTPKDPTDAERMTFNMGHAGMQQGWEGTLLQLTTYLKKIANK